MELSLYVDVVTTPSIFLALAPDEMHGTLVDGPFFLLSLSHLTLCEVLEKGNESGILIHTNILHLTAASRQDSGSVERLHSLTLSIGGEPLPDIRHTLAAESKARLLGLLGLREHRMAISLLFNGWDCLRMGRNTWEDLLSRYISNLTALPNIEQYI